MSAASETLGLRLKTERERKGLSCQKAADELHLDGWVIEGLESGDYSRIGPSVYAKGHLRRYAELLGLPVADILDSFEDPPTDERLKVQPGIRMRTSAPAASDLPWGQVGVLAVSVLVVAGALWWWHPWHPRAGSTNDLPTAQTRPAASAASDAGGGAVGSPPGAQVVPDISGAAATSGTPTPAVAAPAAVAPSAADSTAGAGRARLRLLFLADSWVDVHDAMGQRVFAGNGHANNVRSMSGAAPLRVYIKSASSVHLDINNHSVAIGSQFIVDNAAHFEAGADGVLRRDAQFTAPNAAGSTPSRPRG